jgi:hypothetical protein
VEDRVPGLEYKADEFEHLHNNKEKIRKYEKTNKTSATLSEDQNHESFSFF